MHLHSWKKVSQQAHEDLEIISLAKRVCRNVGFRVEGAGERVYRVTKLGRFITSTCKISKVPWWVFGLGS